MPPHGNGASVIVVYVSLRSPLREAHITGMHTTITGGPEVAHIYTFKIVVMYFARLTQSHGLFDVLFDYGTLSGELYMPSTCCDFT